MGSQEVVASYARLFVESRKMVAEIRSSARTRLVWFVAVAGFAFLNGPPFWSAIASRTFAGTDLVLLALPWAMSALLAVVTHFFVDEAAVKDDRYFVQKLAMVDLHLEAIKEGEDDPLEMLQIIDGTHTDLKKPKAAAERYACWARWLERITFALLVLGFIWSLAIPLVLP
jgi:hypothetical protein